MLLMAVISQFIQRECPTKADAAQRIIVLLQLDVLLMSSSDHLLHSEYHLNVST